MSDKARVLFVDDEHRILTTMRMLFRSDYENHFANSAREALDFLRTHQVDVIVSDQRMPGMTGVDLLREARELRPDAMRILLTGYSDLNAIIGSINEGEIFRFVNKPWSNQELKNTVALAVEAARETRELAVATRGETALSGTDLPVALVLDEDPSVAPALQQIMGDRYRMVGAASMEDALDVMEQQPVGVVITDTRVQGRSVVQLLSELKAHNPELISMIVTARADAGLAIELINQGQIYRFITKPLRETQCKLAVAAAINQHRKLSRHKGLGRRYQVEKKAPEAEDTGQGIGAGLLGRIRSLRSLVARGTA